MKTITRSTRSTNTVELIDWASQYELGDAYPHKDPQRRFGIGFYQLYQGMDWEQAGQVVLAYSEYASFAIHLFLCAGLLKAPIEQWLPEDLMEIQYTQLDHRSLLYICSRLHQQFIYSRFRKEKRYQRKSRYDHNKLTKDLALIISTLFRAIPIYFREESIEHATTIMTGRL